MLGVDVNALNLLGESALSTATCHNQILCVEYLLANRADPKLYVVNGFDHRCSRSVPLSDV